MKEIRKLLDFRQRRAPGLPLAAHSFHKIQPKFSMRTRCLISAHLIVAVHENHSPQLIVGNPRSEFLQIIRKRLHVMEVVTRVFAQILARKRTRTPGLIKRMAKQIMLRNPRIQFRHKFFCRHHPSTRKLILRGTNPT